MKYCTTLVTIFLLLITMQVEANSKFDVKIAIVDVQLILENSLAVQDIRKSIGTISQNIQKELSQKDSELKALEEELIKNRDTVSNEIFEEKVAKFHQKVSAVQKEMQSKKVNLEQAHAAALATVHEATIIIIKGLAKKYNFNLVLPSSQLLYASAPLNITEEVIKQLNHKLTTVKVSY